jgi:hypothetical protein
VITERARDEEQTGQHDDVGIHNPLQLTRGCAKTRNYRRQRNIQNGAVEINDQYRQR